MPNWEIVGPLAMDCRSMGKRYCEAPKNISLSISWMRNFFSWPPPLYSQPLFEAPGLQSLKHKPESGTACSTWYVSSCNSRSLTGIITFHLLNPSCQRCPCWSFSSIDWKWLMIISYLKLVSESHLIAIVTVSTFSFMQNIVFGYVPLCCSQWFCTSI